MICVLGLSSCNKNNSQDNERQTEDLTQKTTLYLIKNTSLSTMGLRDTMNNIRGKLAFIRCQEKDNCPNLKPINKFVETSIHDFSRQVKNLKSVNREDTNRYYLLIHSVVKNNKIISVLFEKKEHLSGGQTIHKFFSFNYDEQSSKQVNLLDIFNVNDKNIDSFNKLFGTSYTVADLKSIDFNFEKDMLWLIDKKAPTKRIGVKQSLLQVFD